MNDLTDLIDNSELNEVMNILENLEDEQLAVELLKDFNMATKELGQLLVDKSPDLDHAAWKVQCDDAKNKVDEIVKKIKRLA